MKKILIIDDQADNLLSVRAMIRMMDIHPDIITAQSGAVGLEKAVSEQPDVIVLDIVMPEMDGFEVCSRLKSNPLTENIPIVFLTSTSTDLDIKVKGLEAGADAFLNKPIEMAELNAQVKVMLRIKQAEDDLRKEKLALETKNKELEEFNNLFIGREMRIHELKEKIKKLEEKIQSENKNK